MTLVKHKQIAGFLLIVFASVNLCICGIMLSKISELSQKDPEQSFNIFFELMVAAVVGTILLLVVQIFAGYKMIRKTPKLYWGLLGSIIAIICGISLPIGIYGLWVSLQSNKES